MTSMWIKTRMKKDKGFPKEGQEIWFYCNGKGAHKRGIYYGHFYGSLFEEDITRIIFSFQEVKKWQPFMRPDSPKSDSLN